MGFKVLISDNVADVCIEKFIENGVEVSNKPGLPADELLNLIPEYDGLVVRSATKVVADVIRQGKQLKVVGRAGTGVDNIDLEVATENGVVVLNSQMTYYQTIHSLNVQHCSEIPQNGSNAKFRYSLRSIITASGTGS